VSRPDLALHHLKHVINRFTGISKTNKDPCHSIAATLSPEDPEIAFNLAAVLEASTRLGEIFISIIHIIKSHRTAGRLEEALIQYKRSEEHGVERAGMHIRNVHLVPFLPVFWKLICF
jgi:hypothetical protein